MKILVLGSGAKDHAITWKFSKSKRLTGLYIAPGNAGTACLGINLTEVDPSDPQAVLDACLKYDIDYVFAGTEAPLASGVVDQLLAEGIQAFGATKTAVKLEGDRSFARNFTKRHNIPIPEHYVASTIEELSSYIIQYPHRRFVLKKNGLSPSRIMIDSADPELLMTFGKQLLENDEVHIEEHLKGMPITLTILTDENGYLLLPVSSDYTKADEHDTSAATGGMGSICPVPVLNDNTRKQIIDTIVSPTLLGLQQEGLSYKGVLIFSLILTESGPKLVDYHVRFNDPATQAMLPLIQSDFIDILDAMGQQHIADYHLKISNKTAVAVVVASRGYPGKPEIGKEIFAPAYVFSNMVIDQSIVFSGAVTRQQGKLITDGGRCFSVVGLGANILEANEAAYSNISEIKFDGAWYRKDIGNQFFEE